MGEAVTPHTPLLCVLLCTQPHTLWLPQMVYRGYPSNVRKWITLVLVSAGDVLRGFFSRSVTTQYPTVRG